MCTMIGFLITDGSGGQLRGFSWVMGHVKRHGLQLQSSTRRGRFVSGEVTSLLHSTRLWTLWSQNELKWYFQRGRNHVNSSYDVIFIGVGEMRIWKIGSGFLRQRFAFRRVYPRQGDDSMHNGGIFGTQNSRWSQGGHRFQRGSDKYYSLLFQNSNFTNGPEICRKITIAQASSGAFNFLTRFRRKWVILAYS